MEILNNVSLRQYNTFGIEARASFFAIANSLEEIQKHIYFSRSNHLKVLLIGGGSNILFTHDYDGLVVKIELKGITAQHSGGDKILVTVGAGENWSNFVEYCLEQGWGGVENLSLIPGTVGAAPIQNIGAYGVELKDVFHSLTALDLVDFTQRNFSAPDCRFGYRDSVFKKELKNRLAIVSVTFTLSTKPAVNLLYPALESEIRKSGQKPTIRSVADAVIRIRRSKLPDPEVLCNAGSFFKNPLTNAKHLKKLLIDWPDIPNYKQPDDLVKIPAAWLIEKCGWKGKQYGEAGVHVSQPLVLVNYGHASGKQILELAERIKESVHSKFDILLEPEVNII